jgi:hypothetical protein
MAEHSTHAQLWQMHHHGGGSAAASGGDGGSSGSSSIIARVPTSVVSAPRAAAISRLPAAVKRPPPLTAPDVSSAAVNTEQKREMQLDTATVSAILAGMLEGKTSGGSNSIESKFKRASRARAKTIKSVASGASAAEAGAAAVAAPARPEPSRAVDETGSAAMPTAALYVPGVSERDGVPGLPASATVDHNNSDERIEIAAAAATAAPSSRPPPPRAAKRQRTE